MTTTSTALERANAAIRGADAELRRVKWNRDLQDLKARADRLDLRLAHIRAGQLLRAADERDRGTRRR